MSPSCARGRAIHYYSPDGYRGGIRCYPSCAPVDRANVRKSIPVGQIRRLMFLCLMRHLILVFLIATFSVSAQKEVSKIPVNELELNTPLSMYEQDVFLLTGEEEFYRENENLRQNVLRNIEKGIREGQYAGYTASVIDGIKASTTTLFFYKEELYKVRWSFLPLDHPDLAANEDQLDRFLTEKYGPGDEQIPDLLKVWQSKKRYLQSFSEEYEFQIEYRDEKIHTLVEALK